MMLKLLLLQVIILFLANNRIYVLCKFLLMGFCVFFSAYTAGAKGRFSGGFDISGFGDIQKGTSNVFSVSWYLC